MPARGIIAAVLLLDSCWAAAGLLKDCSWIAAGLKIEAGC